MTEKGRPLRAGGISVALVKRQLTMKQLLEHYDADLPDDRVSSAYDGWLSMRCPFHDDSRASASVNFRENRFRCHGCEVGGDVIDLVAEEEGISTKEALEWIRQNLL